MKVAIGGSRRLPAGQAPRLLIRFLVALPADSSILLRTPMSDAPGAFERDVFAVCQAVHLDVVWYRPEPTETTTGRASVYARDIDMIAAADLVLLFFVPEEAVDGYSGTAHLMDKALDQDRIVYAYTVDGTGDVRRFGEYDPEHRYADLVSA
jgi:hypothetical protein